MEPENVTIQGYYIKTVMRNLKDGYTVFQINTGKDIKTCAGIIVLPVIGSKVEVTGKARNTKYGQQISVESMRELHTDRVGMTEYLKQVKGIGNSLSDALIDKFGEALYSSALGKDAVEKLCTVPGMTEAKAEALIAHVKKTETYRKLFDIISRHGGKFSLISKIYKDYENQSVEALLRDPYKIGIRYGLPFSVCDGIAFETGIKPLDTVRVAGACGYALSKNTSQGHAYCMYADVYSHALKLLDQYGAYDEALTSACIYIAVHTHKRFIIEDNMVYLRSVYHDEKRTAYAIKRLVKSAKPITGQSLEKLVQTVEERVGCTYAPQQREAFQLILNGGVGIITGGPGTGKSTVVNGLLTAYRMIYPENKIKLCAPTGRAAQRMKECCQTEASTIHKLLDYKPFGDSATCKDEADPIEADLIVVDECSMISIDVAAMLFSAIKSGTQVILCGDVDQLPAVGAGNVLRDMIESGIVPTVSLTQTYRQAEDSAIITNAKRIRTGVTSLLQAKDFTVITCDDAAIPSTVLDLYHQYTDPADIFSAQVLTPGRRKRETASNALSKYIQKSLKFSGSVLRYGETLFHLNDRIMFIRNNYEAGYCNGDVGIISEITGSELSVTVNDEKITVHEHELDDVVLAYAVTIHKSQGSEYKTAIVVLPSEPVGMLQRNLLYTAITRAKSKCIVVAARGTIRKAIENREALWRNSCLTNRLQAL